MIDDIFITEKEAIRKGMKNHEIAPGFNPQQLTVGEIKRRCSEINLTKNLGGSYRVSGYNYSDILD